MAGIGKKSFGLMLLCGSAMGMVPLAGHAQTTQAPAAEAQPEQAPIIQQIVVRGNQRIESETVRSYLPIRPGQPINQITIDAGLKTLFATGLFADAEMVYDNGTLVVNVLENPIVNRVLFEGNRATKEDKLTEDMQLEARSVYTRAKVQSDTQRIIEVYRRSGRFGATVTPKIVELPQNRVDIIYEIEEGPKTGVAKINFIGNTHFSDAELRGAILTAESNWWNLFESNDNYDPDRLEYDRQQLRDFYTKQGYADFSVVSAVAELTPDRKNFFINFTVEEGPQYEFGKIDVRTTLAKIPGDYLERVIPIRTGNQFNSELMEKAEEAITYSTGVAGYAFVDVRPQLTRNPETKTVDVTFEVNEGPRVYVERINIRGNTQTLDHVIRREMRLSEGDAFNRVLVDRSERRIKGLGYFSEVTIEEQPGSAPDRTVLDVALAEQSTGSFQVGAGLSSADAFILNFQIEQRNLLGRGQYLLMDFQASSRTQRARLSFTEPFFLGRRLNAGLSLFANKTDYEEAGYVADTVGAGANLGFPVSEFGSLSLSYQLRSDNILLDRRTSVTIPTGADPSDYLLTGTTDFSLSPSTSGQVLTTDVCNLVSRSLDPTCESRGDFLTSQVGYTMRFDQRNDPLVPSRGWFFDVSQALAGLGGDVQYLRTTARGSAYRPLPYDLVGALKFDVGYIDGFGDDGIRVNDRFYKGGNRGFRGFDVAGVGPRYFDPSSGYDRAIGARAYAIGSVEARLPLPLPPEYGIRASLFSDFGAVGIIDEEDKLLNNDLANWGEYYGDRTDGIQNEPVQDDFSLRVTAGVSINWRSPFGPVQIDIAEALKKEEYDEEQVFRFSAGGNF
ncbi:outer membrane protein assembly factor BamA [Parvularcula sp. LCG005]|uniref:outer membrane protein assembly factor BamA n=1 Tax=Parvularcula sp. LCG005 TaxID=3078805 RepID=UPI002942C07F|nr:outer membrane protein assembly factor BamA [Parvularcula sp. LCG005]WOI52757.1 outer membrane protein assembly factor BamA [Parvularcula sp. LCG005]